MIELRWHAHLRMQQGSELQKKGTISLENFDPIIASLKAQLCLPSGRDFFQGLSAGVYESFNSSGDRSGVWVFGEPGRSRGIEASCHRCRDMRGRRRPKDDPRLTLNAPSPPTRPRSCRSE